MNYRAQRTLPGLRGFLGPELPEPAALVDGQALVVTIPGIELRSLNVSFRGASRGARMGAAAKIRKQRDQVSMALRCMLGNPPAPPLVITLTRIAPGTLDAHDNLPGACKATVDAIAAWLELDDRDPRLTWRYAQSRSRPGEYAVTIRLEGRPA